MFPYFYPAMMPQYCPSVCPSVTFRYCDHICWNTSKIISPPNSDKIVKILAQSSTAFLLTHNFQGTHILGASRGRLSDSVASGYYWIMPTDILRDILYTFIAGDFLLMTFGQKGQLPGLKFGGPETGLA